MTRGVVAEIQVGERFGKLVVVERANKPEGSKETAAFWLCKCDCGNKKKVRSSDLLSRGTKSCGCLRSPDITGQRFGRLTAVRKTEKRYHNGVVWQCLCDCGNTVFARSSALRSGAKKHCGCYLDKDTGKLYPKGEAIFRAIFRRIGSNAKDRDLSWEVSLEDFR